MFFRYLHPPSPGDQDDDFDQRIRRFVASKADLLFSMEGKQKLQRGVDYGMHSNQEGTVIKVYFFLTLTILFVLSIIELNSCLFIWWAIGPYSGMRGPKMT